MRFFMFCSLLFFSAQALAEGWALYYGEKEDQAILRSAAAIQAKKCIDELETCPAKPDPAPGMPSGRVEPDCFVGMHAGKKQFVCVHPFSVEPGSCGSWHALKVNVARAKELYDAYDKKTAPSVATSCCHSKTCKNVEFVKTAD